MLHDHALDAEVDASIGYAEDFGLRSGGRRASILADFIRCRPCRPLALTCGPFLFGLLPSPRIFCISHFRPDDLALLLSQHSIHYPFHIYVYRVFSRLTTICPLEPIPKSPMSKSGLSQEAFTENTDML